MERRTACPMETRGLLAEWDDAAGRMVVYGRAICRFRHPGYGD